MLINRLARRFSRHLSTISWQVMVATLFAYAALSWLGLYWAGEAVAKSPLLFWYFLVVTSSTVGYGDYSATTDAGMLVISVWIIPIGLVMWGAIIGRFASAVINYLKRGVKGMRQIHYTGHTLVIGYNGARTQMLLRLLLREAPSSDDANLVLCANVDKIAENPMPGSIGFVRVDSFSNAEQMALTNLQHAKTILIDTPLDDITLTTAIFCQQQAPGAHITAYFEDETTGQLLRNNYPNIECIPSVTVEMLAKAAADPGSSALHQELLNVDKGQTQYSVEVPEGVNAFALRDIYLSFKERHQATVIALQTRADGTIVTNPKLDTLISPGDRIYYIADERIETFSWEQK